MKFVFADAGYWIALLNVDDDGHRIAIATSQSLGEFRIFTSELIVVELLNHYSRYGSRFRQAAVELGRDISSDPQVTVVPFTQDLLRNGIELYAERKDKKWGLADCISFIIMNEYGIAQAIAFDEHFAQTGLVSLFR